MEIGRGAEAVITLEEWHSQKMEDSQELPAAGAG